MNVRVEKEPPVTRTIKISLSQREAEALWALTFRVGGHPDKSPRGLIDQLRDALEEAFPTMSGNSEGWMSSGVDSVRFKDWTEVG
jgi:hypothetical protein